MLAFSLPGTATVSQDINGSGGLQQKGPGVLALASPYTNYSGPTIVSGGTLQGGVGGYQFNFIGSGSILSGATVPNNAIPAFSGTMHGTGASYVAGPGSSTAIQFNTGQLLKSATGPGALNTFTISFWMETPDTGGPTGQYVFDSRAFAGDGNGSAFLWYGDQGWRPLLRIGGTDGNYAYNNWMGEAGGVAFPWPMNGNQWFMVTVEAEPGQIQAFVDGQWINTYPITDTPQFQSAGSPVEIGGRVDNSTYFNGSVADFAVYNSFLTAAQISTLYSTGLGPVSGNLSPNSPVQMGAGVLDLGGAGQTVLSLADYGGGGGVVTNNGAAATLTFAPTGGTTVYSGAIQDGTGQTSLTLNGPGMQVLSGVNTYSGQTTISAGTLEAKTTAALSNYNNTGYITVAPGAMLAVSVGGAGEWNSGVNDDIATLAANASFAPGGALGIDTTDATGGMTYSGALSGAFGLTKIGPNTLTLAGANTYSGATTIAAGTLQLTDGGSVNSSSGIVNNSDLAFNAVGALIVTPAISGTGTVEQLGSGVTILAGANTYTGLTTISGGTLQVGNGVTGSLGNTSIVDNGVLAFNSASTIAIGGPITGGGAVLQTGPGLAIINGASSYTGPTIITGGTLQAIGSNLGSLPAPLMHIAFDGSLGTIAQQTSIPDSSGNSYSLTLYNNWGGNASYVAGKFGNAIHFTNGQMALIGAYNPVTSSYGTNPLPTMNSWTASLWVNISAGAIASGGQTPFFGNRWPKDNGTDLWYNSSNNTISALVINSADNNWLVNRQYSATLSANTWYMVTETVTAGQFDLYVDGSLVGQQTLSDTPQFNFADSTLALGYANGNFGSGPFSVNDFRLYNTR